MELYPNAVGSKTWDGMIQDLYMNSSAIPIIYTEAMVVLRRFAIATQISDN